MFEPDAVVCPISDLVLGNAVSAEAEQHVGVDEARFMQLQQKAGDRISSHLLITLPIFLDTLAALVNASAASPL
jgi:hypothetical protein